MEEIRKNGILAFRCVQILGVLAFIVGIMWQTADSFRLTIPQYMMLYGGMWAVISEAAIQVLKWKFPEPTKPTPSSKKPN